MSKDFIQTVYGSKELLDGAEYVEVFLDTGEKVFSHVLQDDFQKFHFDYKWIKNRNRLVRK